MSQSPNQNANAGRTEQAFEADLDLLTGALGLNSNQKKELWTFIGERREMLRENMCLHPVGDCSGVICNSHSIQQSKLSAIAKAGYVYSVEFDLGEIVKKPLLDNLKRLHIEKATVFRGFCSTHDADLFRPIETQDFQCTSEQLYLYFYRAICRELHVKHCIAKADITVEDIARLHPTMPKHIYEEPINWRRTHLTAEALKLHLFKVNIDNVLLNGEFRRLKHYVITFKRRPSVLSAAATAPTCDFAGKGFRLVSHPLLPYPIMTITTLPTLSGGVAILSWFDNGPVEFDQFCSSLEAVSASKITSSLIRFLFEFCANIAIAPDWWEALPIVHRNTLLKHARSGIPPNRMSESCLTDDGLCYDDWEVEMRFRL